MYCGANRRTKEKNVYVNCCRLCIGSNSDFHSAHGDPIYSQQSYRCDRETISAEGSVKSGFIAMNDEAGYQPRSSAAGLHHPMPIQYVVHMMPLVTISQGKVGYIFARHGKQLDPAQVLGFECQRDRFSGCGSRSSRASANTSARRRARQSAPGPSATARADHGQAHTRQHPATSATALHPARAAPAVWAISSGATASVQPPNGLVVVGSLLGITHRLSRSFRCDRTGCNSRSRLCG